MASDTGTRKRKQSPQKRSSRSASPAVVKKKLVKRGSLTEDERDDDKDTSLSKKTMMRKAVCKAAVTRDDDEEATPNGSQENIPYEDIVRQNNGTATIPVDDEHNTGQDKDTIQDAEDVERGEQIKPASQTTTQNDDEMQVDNDETNVENPKPDSTSTETSTTNRSDDSKNTVDAEAQQNDEDAQTAGSASKTPAANILSSAVKSAVRAEAQRTPSKSVKQHEIPKKDLIDNSDDGNIDGSPMKIRVSKFKKLDQSKAIQEALGANRDLAGEIEKIEKEWIELNRRFGDWMQRGHEMMVRQSSCRLSVQLQQVEQEEKSCLNEMQRLKTFQRAMKDAWQSINNADMCA